MARNSICGWTAPHLDGTCEHAQEQKATEAQERRRALELARRTELDYIDPALMRDLPLQPWERTDDTP